MKATTSTPRPNHGESPSAMTLAPNTIPETTISFQTPAPSARPASGTATATAPIELADIVGLDVCLHVGRILAAAYGGPAPDAVAPLVEAGKLGKKSGQGLYEWRDGKPVKPPAAPGAKVPDDLEDRLMLALVNEAMAVLREGVVADADLIDAGVIFGSGFAPFRGGPLRYAEERGVAAVVARLEALAAQHGEQIGRAHV
jgi:3-hydroxyacyl-CoA dehydrogenase/enoyl-CoA hydratase/3-hydroxybutyryl-CoA epimerase